MSNRDRILASLGLTLILGASIASAQSLGEFARKERERLSKEAKKATKVYTNENMPARPRDEGATAAGGISPTPVSAPSADSQANSEPASSTSTKAGAGGAQKTDASGQSQEDKLKTKEYWQARFKQVRARLAGTKEQQQLVEDELALLQIQQAREISAEIQAEIARKISAKQAELETRRAETAKVEKALADLELEFKDSGAPEEWSKTEESAPSATYSQ